MLILKLAYRNLVGAGLRTWLKVAVLSLSYVLIIWHYGFFSGMQKQASRAMIEDEIAGGQYWHKNYDPYDFMSLDNSHGVIPAEMEALIRNKVAVPILIRQAAIYPEGRVQSVLLKGIEPSQTVLGIPTAKLDFVSIDGMTPLPKAELRSKHSTEETELPVLIGKRMAKSNSLKIGDYLTIRWRDAKGTFDAIEGKIVEIMDTQIPTIDSRQLWVPLKDLQRMSGLDNQATMIVVGRNVPEQADLLDWKFKGHDFLLKDLNDMVRGKRIGGAIMYFILLFLAMLAIFDTQILSIFRRRKEIGTLMALGMTRSKVISLFTLEGALIGVLAAAVASIYGTPLIYFTATKGIGFPQIVEEYGFALSSRLFPTYSAGLVTGTVIIIMVTTTIVSYLPSRKISKLKPTEALKGKIS